jgi:hypothetical protein
MTAKRLFPGPALGSEPAGDNRITLRNANPETLTECTLKRYSLTSFKKNAFVALAGWQQLPLLVSLARRDQKS